MNAPSPSSTGTETLLPCPFCGATPTAVENWEWNFARRFVYCEPCGGRSPNFGTEAEAVYWWNNRAPQPVSVAQRQPEPVTGAGSSAQELLVRAEAYLCINAPDGRGSALLVMELADALRAAPLPASSAGGEIVQHIGWLKQYVQGMTADNWQDMRLRAERQLDELSRDIRGVAYTAQEPVAMLGGVHGVMLIRHIEAMLPAARTEYHTPLYKHPAPRQSAPVFKATQNTAESDPAATPDWAGADTPSMSSTHQSSPAATIGDIPSEPRPPASAAMGLSAGGETELATAKAFLREKPSTSYLQRKMQITYNHALRLMTALENEGFISIPDSQGRRTILVTSTKRDGEA